MARYRIGNDMTILWTVNGRDGSALPLKDKEVHLYYTCERGRFEANFEIQGTNVVAWNFLGKNQRALGDYTLSLEILQSDGKRTIKMDKCNAFSLVGRNCEELYDNADADINEGGELTIVSNLDIYRISPIIPYVVKDNNGIGYWYVDGVETGDRSTGESAYEYALTKGFDGTEEEFAALTAKLPNVSAELAKLSEEIYRDAKKYSSDILESGYYDMSIGVAPSVKYDNGGYLCARIELHPYKRYILSVAPTNSSSAAAFGITSKAGQPWKELAIASEGAENKVIEVSENSLLYVNARNASANYSKFKLLEESTSQGINAQLANKADKYFGLDDLRWIDNECLGIYGEVLANTAYHRSEMISLDYGKLDSVSLIGRASDVISIAYYDENKKFCGYQLGTLVTDVQIPTSAKYFSLIENKYNKAGNYANILLVAANVAYASEGGETFLKTLDDSKPLNTIIHDGGFVKIFRTIGIIGDSLSSGEMAYSDSVDESSTQYIDMYEYSWGQYMARYCGNVVHNFSMGGLSTRTFLQDVGGYASQCFNDESKKCQCYFIALGHNDRNQSIPIGSPSDIHSDYNLNADTYYGNYAKIISKIKEVQPKAKIFCICMKNEVFAEYNAAIKYMKSVFPDIYILEMDVYNPTIESWEYTKGHGNAMGYLNYSYQIASYVDWIIRHNKKEFDKVQFIGTDYE